MNIELEHPDYVSRKSMWRKYRDLYAGGEALRSNATEYLVRRQKEPAEVYSERLAHVFYENYIGSIIDWYAATAFRREPTLDFRGPDKRSKQFYAEFTEDCDRKGTNLTAFLRRQLVEALIQGSSYTLVDFPRSSLAVETRAEEDAVGRSRAYLVDYSSEHLINWEQDIHGTYEWVVLRQSNLRKSPNGDGWERETTWSYYDRSKYRVYRRTGPVNGFAIDGSRTSEVELMDEGSHALKDQGRVPLFELKISEGLWLMNKAGLLQMEHFNKSNALSWALTMGLFAVPVVYSDRDWNQIVGEAYYIQLGKDDRFGWNEPEGHVYQIAADNLVRLQEEIYRVCYLLGQAGSPSGTAQSGLSKQRDFAITQEVLRAYGDLVKDHMKRVLGAVGDGRKDDLSVDVSGLDDFDINDFAADLSDAARLLALDAGSPTLKRMIYQRLASKYLCDARQEVKEQIFREIQEAVSKKGV